MKDDTGGRILLPKPQGYRCFACGTSNDKGLGMSFYCEGNTVRSDIVLNDCHVGWENIAHGGIVSTLLDEIMGWTVIAFKRAFFVTRSMKVRYLKPVAVNVPLTAVGQIDPEPLKGGCRTVASLLSLDGVKLAVAKAEMVFLSEKRLPILPGQYRHDMEALFLQLDELLGPMDS